MIKTFDYLKSLASLEHEILDALKRVLKSGYLILGPETEAFEQEFAEFVGVQHCIGVNSGTTALHIALMGLGVGPGDEVITVSHTAVATIAALELTGARPVFVDIDPLGYTMDPSQVEDKITPATKVIMPVHIYGQVADMEPILALARRHGLRVVEDAAQAHGAEYRGRKAGSLADVGCFSFYPTKNLGAYGDGGMVVTNNPALAQRLALLRQYGWGERYVSSIKGLNSRLDELQAAILRVKLRWLDRWNGVRREHAALYNELLRDSAIIAPAEMEHGKHCYHLYVIRCERRDELHNFLRGKGVGALIHYPVPVHLQEAYQDLGLTEGALPVTEGCSRQVLTLPVAPELSEEQIRTVGALVHEFLSLG